MENISNLFFLLKTLILKKEKKEKILQKEKTSDIFINKDS